MSSQQDLLLLTGIPGTGKTWYGEKLASDFGFDHYDLEQQQTLNRFGANPAQFIADIIRRGKKAVATWGFVPDDVQTAIVLQFRDAGFKWIWFDGNRPAALHEFRKRGTVSEELLYAQMYRIENSRIVQRLRPIVIDTFDSEGQFKAVSDLLKEIQRA